MELLGVGQVGVRAVIQIDHLVLLVVLTVVSGIPRLAVQRLHIVVDLRAGFGVIFIKTDIFSRHGINTAKISLLI